MQRRLRQPLIFARLKRSILFVIHDVMIKAFLYDKARMSNELDLPLPFPA